MWVKLLHDRKTENYICNQNGTQMERVAQMNYQGQDIDPNSVIGFSPKALVSAIGTETGYVIVIYHLKK